MMKQQQSITTLPLSPEEERRRRMIRYAVTMGIRMVCIVMMLFVQGWWLVVCALGAILLPYFAVIAANVHGDQRSQTVLRPGTVAVLPGPDPATSDPTRPRPTPPDAGAHDDSASHDDASHDSKDPR